MGVQRQRPLAPLLRHTAVTMEATTSFSLSLSLTLYTQLRTVHIQLQKCSTTVFSQSHVYTHMTFRAIYTYGPKRLTKTHLHMCPLPIRREDHHRALDHPVLLSFPSEGAWVKAWEWEQLAMPFT